MISALTQHWPEYAIEAALLGAFMVSACVFAVWLSHPGSPLVRRWPRPFGRRAAMGLAMGLTAATLIYSPWGRQSGAHLNPAVTLTYFFRGKVALWDAVFYVLAQFAGGVAGVTLARLTLRERLRHPAVDHVATVPGPRGARVAWLAELAISGGLMFVVLYASNHSALASYAGLLAAALVAAYITFEAPLSGMSMNPARTLASAVVARRWSALWVYFTAPIVGMLLASALHAALPGRTPVYCAKLNHGGDQRCIFRCEFHRLRPRMAAPALQTRREAP